MDIGSVVSQGSMVKLGAGNWCKSAECAEKVEEMLNRAIVQQEDLLRMLILHSPHHDHDVVSAIKEHGHCMNNMSDDVIPPIVHRVLKGKLHSSMDWCHLALCRLNEILSHPPACPRPELRTATAGSPSWFLKHELMNMESQIAMTRSKWKLHTPLSPIQADVPLNDEELYLSSSPHPLTNKRQRFSRSTPSTAPDSPSGYLAFADTPKSTAPATPSGDRAALNSEPGSSSQNSQQGQNLAGPMGLLLMDSNPRPADISEAFKMSHFCDPEAADFTRQITTSSCQPHAPAPNVSAGTDAAARIKTDNSEIARKASTDSIKDHRQNPSRRHPIRQKRDRGASAEENKSEIIQYQRLQPGGQTKGNIPCDGHRDWKKYGNKTILNATFCRGYYKCSVRECNAKKMVQPMDKDPSTFKVTYMGQHTSSRTSNNSLTGRKPLQQKTKISAVAMATTTTAPAAASTAITSSDQLVHQEVSAPSTDSQKAVLSTKLAAAGPIESDPATESNFTMPSSSESPIHHVCASPQIDVDSDKLLRSHEELLLLLQAPISDGTAPAAAGRWDLESNTQQEGCESFTDTSRSGSDDDWPCSSNSKGTSEADQERTETDNLEFSNKEDRDSSTDGNTNNNNAVLVADYDLENNLNVNFPTADLSSSFLSWTHEFDVYPLLQLTIDNYHHLMNSYHVFDLHEHHQQLTTTTTTAQH